MDRKNAVRIALAFILGFAILFYLLWSMGFDRIADLLLKVRPELFLLAALFYVGNEVVGALSLKCAFAGKIRLRTALPSHMCGMLYSAVTPGRAGYYYTAFSVAKKMKDSRSKSIGILTLLQGVGFFVKVVAAILAVIYLSRYIISQEHTNYLFLAALTPIVFVALIVVLLYTTAFNKVLEKTPILNRSIKYVSSMQAAVREVEKKTLAKFLFLAFLSWFLMGAQWYLLSLSLGFGLSYWDVLFLQPLLSAVMFIPLTPSGLGLTEGGSALLFTVILSSLPSEEAKAAGVTFMLLVRLNSIIVDSLGLIDMRIHAS